MQLNVSNDPPYRQRTASFHADHYRENGAVGVEYSTRVLTDLLGVGQLLRASKLFRELTDRIQRNAEPLRQLDYVYGQLVSVRNDTHPRVIKEIASFYAEKIKNIGISIASKQGIENLIFH